MRRQVEQRQQEALADAAPAPGREDRERRHVRLVDHQPDAGVGDDPGADADDEVVGQPVRLELGPEGVWRPGRGEAGPLDGVDAGDVVEPHGLDEDAQRRVGRPCHRSGRLAHAARQRHVGGHERRQRRRWRRASRRDARGARSAAAEPARTARPAGQGVRRRPVGSRSTRDSSPARSELRLGARPASPRRSTLGDRRGPGRAGRPAGARRPSGVDGSTRCGGTTSATPVETPTIGSPSPCASVLAVARPTRRPVNAPGPVPTTIAPRSPRPTPARAEHAVDPAEQLLAVAVAGAPRRLGERVPPSAGRRATTAERRGRVDGEERAVGARGHAATPRGSARRRGRRGGQADRPRLVAGPVDPRPRAGRVGSARVEPVGPLDERDAVGLALVEQPASDRLGRSRQAIEVEVEERQPALVLGHEHEARRVDGLGRRRDPPRSPWRTGSCRPRGRPTGR